MQIKEIENLKEVCTCSVKIKNNHITGCSGEHIGFIPHIFPHLTVQKRPAFLKHSGIIREDFLEQLR